MRSIHISVKAKQKVNRQAIWYRKYRGEKFVQTMVKNLHADIKLLSSSPTIGLPYTVIDGTQLYSISSNKRSLIIYWYNETDLFVDDIVFTRSQH